MKGTRLINQLKAQFDKANSEVEMAKLELSVKQKEYNAKMLELNKIKEKLNSLELDEPVISDHAFVRYFERVKGFNLDDIQSEVFTDKIKEMIETLGGSGQYPNENGYALVMKNNVVTTILKN